MPQVMVWKCPKTGFFYESKPDYIESLKRRAKESMRVRAVRREHDALAERFAEMRRLTSFDDIRAWMVENGHLFFLNEAMKWDHRVDDIDLTDCRITRVDFEAAPKWRKDCSISHTAPIGMQTNWCGKDEDRPRHMPGFEVRMSVYYSRRASDRKDRGRTHRPYAPEFKNTGIGTNGGSGGGLEPHKNVMHWYAVFFAQDWPSLVTLQALKGEIDVA